MICSNFCCLRLFLFVLFLSFLLHFSLAWFPISLARLSCCLSASPLFLLGVLCSSYQALSRLKSDGGILFSCFSTMLCGGILPFPVMAWQQQKLHDTHWLIIHFVFWSLWMAECGLEVDLFYRGLPVRSAHRPSDFFLFVSVENGDKMKLQCSACR